MVLSLVQGIQCYIGNENNIYLSMGFIYPSVLVPAIHCRWLGITTACKTIVNRSKREMKLNLNDKINGQYVFMWEFVKFHTGKYCLQTKLVHCRMTCQITP